MSMHRSGGEPVGDDEDDIDRARPARGEAFARAGIEPPSEIGPAQIGRPVARGRAQHQGLETAAFDRGGDRGRVEDRVHGVAGERMGQLEIEMGAGRQGRAGAAEPDARRGRAAQRRPRQGGAFAHASPASSRRNGAEIASGRSGPARLPAASVIPMRSSQASNSGAGRLPSARRR